MMAKEEHRQRQHCEEWEQSKENIQPLKKGRNMESLCNALRSEQSDNEHRQLAIRKMEFENALRLYKGSDPLEPWVSYVEWTEQHFPKGGKAGSLCPLIEKCIANFRDNDRYKNDERFVNICLKLANMSIDPPEVYSFMYRHKTGNTVASFYTTWAQALEAAGDVKKADAIYLKGLQNKAQPVELLESRHKEFLNRIAKVLPERKSHATVDAQSEDCRVVMGTLKTSGRKEHLGTGRAGAAIENYVNRGHQVGIASLKGKSTGSITVCVDTVSTEKSLLPDMTDAKENAIMLALAGLESTKENELKPERWAGVKFSQRKTVQAALKFDVHCDEVSSPRQVPHIILPAATTLSEKKNIDSDSLRAFRRINTVTSSTGQLKEVTAFDQSLLFGGVEELQFEEVRAAVYMKRKAERETEQLIEEQKQRIQQMEAKMSEMQKQNADILKLVKMLLHSQRLPADRDSIKMIMNQIGHTATEQDILDATIFCSSEQLSLPKSLQEQQVMETTVSAAAEISLPARTTTFNPTPTMHTKEAMTIAMKIFNKPNNCSIYDQSEAIVFSENAKECGQSRQLGFEIYLDQPAEVVSELTATRLQHEQNIINVEGLTIDACIPHQREENTLPSFKTCPEDFKKREALSAVKFSIYMDQQDPSMMSDVRNRENNCPDDYPLQRSSRAISGISIPPTNVQLLPSEFLDNDQENVNTEHGNNHLKDNKHVERDAKLAVVTDDYHAIRDFVGSPSFVMPANTLVFVDNAKLVSTPVGTSFSISSACKPLTEVQRLSDELNLASANVNSDSNVRLSVKDSEVQIDSLTHTVADVDRKFLNLSTIVETSRDYKSSSGSSGTSSAAASHFRTTFLWNKTGGEFSSLHEKSERLPAAIEKQTESDAPSITDDNSTTVCYADPFDSDLISKFLDELPVPIFSRRDVTVIHERMPAFSTKSIISVYGEVFVIGNKIGAGSYATIFRVNRSVNKCNKKDGPSLPTNMVIKVQSPACTWEFYIASELRSRLDQLHLTTDIKTSVMHISHVYIFDDGSVFTTEFHKCTLLDLVNHFVKNNQAMSEALIMYLTMEILHIVEQFHACNIIHADVKPDNFLIMDVLPIQEPNSVTPFGQRTCLLKLIDYGRCIDMSLFPAGTEFRTRVETECFDCIEMKENKPWTYQTDLYGVASTVHVMLFGKYMEPKKKANGTGWHIGRTIRRYWQTDFWNQFFDQLLNVPSSNKLPNLAELRSSLERCLVSCPKMLLELKARINDLRVIYSQIKS